MSTGTAPHSAEEWNDAWKARQAARPEPHDSSFWDERAKSFTTKDAPGSYTDRFLELAAIRPGDTIFDMGCGTGNLSIPLGSEGHDVLAADFSPVMLDRLRAALRERDITCVRPLHLSWEADWEAAGVEPGSYDVCIASRSIATPDLADSLAKLTAVARRRVCITLACSTSPRIDDTMLHDIGIETGSNPDAIYALAILFAWGYLPELTYIMSERNDAFRTFDEAYDKYARMVEAVLREDSPERRAALDRLHGWLDHNLVQRDGALTLKQPRRVAWAFISWNKEAA